MEVRMVRMMEQMGRAVGPQPLSPQLVPPTAAHFKHSLVAKRLPEAGGGRMGSQLGWAQDFSSGT